MADFVAVIRRTVDGLSDNVPEMRAKVYEKARGAVRRQLENMKPRPSDDMIERQMVKLEAAINVVESDHAEALPALDDEQFEPAAEVATEPAELAEAPAEDTVDEDARPEETPSEEAPAEEAYEAQPPVAEEQSYEPEEAYAEPVSSEEERTEAAEHVEAVASEPEPAAEVEEAHVEQDEPAAASEEDWRQPDVIEAEAPVEQEEPVEEQEATEATPHDEGDYAAAAEQADVTSPDTSVPEETHLADHPEEEELAALVKADESAVPAAASSEWELPEWQDPVPVAAHTEPVWTEAADEVSITDEIPDLSKYEPIETVTPLHADTRDKGEDTAEPSHSWAWDDRDPFTQSPSPGATEGTEPAISDWSWPVEKQAPVEPEENKLSGENWNEIDELLEHGSAATVAGAAMASQQGRDAASAAEDLAAPTRPVSYRAEPKRSRFNAKVAGIAAAVLLIGVGAGYAYWQNQNAVNSWVATTIDSLTAEVPGKTTPGASAPEQDAKDATTPNAQNETPSGTDVASLGKGKFTQRLQTDGTEIDDGPAAAPGADATTEEGKSVAAQTEAGKPLETAQVQTGDAQPAQPVPEQQTATQQIPAGAQKMFLYEERLGQSAPTAIEGNVAWSIKEESPGGDAKPEPVIQAQINVPERGLTALMTIKRNVDASLPASHVIEFVFSLPENFEGGAIESVQRVAMKRAEQDRGDPLIAVPAKITDDFHMIALNDFPEAVATNTELLRGRSWIDIPLTYRNGRRALLTLEKGPAGTEAFTKAMQAWSLVAKPNPAGQ